MEILARHEEHATRNSHSFASSPSQYVSILLCIQHCFGHRNTKGEEDSVTGLTVDCVPADSPEPGPWLTPSSQSASGHLLLSEYGNDMNAYWSLKQGTMACKGLGSMVRVVIGAYKFVPGTGA